MPPTHPPPTELLHAYRHLLQHALRACRYAKPARFALRDRLRNAFRSSSSSSSSSSEVYNPDRIQRTLDFLASAAESKGLEYRVVKNLAHVWWEREKLGRMPMRADIHEFRRHAHDEFDRTIGRLNESMGLCIK
ncbi:hypothetical protein B0A55_09086 [Friedmanniomyces simplex]|uniref:DUF1763-domain-containing protein n=1 Tax=Friedmanniomyces simplex TaxID=329884 RepID=A0A4V5NGQ8_9PEZI|nr:hypothetical protein B0A55_09086 [Friedmanniomyces simplex]